MGSVFWRKITRRTEQQVGWWNVKLRAGRWVHHPTVGYKYIERNQPVPTTKMARSRSPMKQDIKLLAKTSQKLDCRFLVS